jgi:hypothetical protein
MSPFYRLLGDRALPHEIDALTPSQIASMLGWDQQQRVRVVPMTDEEAEAPTAPPTVRSVDPDARPKLRRVVT